LHRRLLARSTRDLLNILHALAERGAKFRSLHDPWCDTSTPQGELLVTILAGFATFERHLIKARTDAGRKRAKARGSGDRENWIRTSVRKRCSVSPMAKHWST
jgi:DNA invertase Pin-like site-specific DNA recombinase